MGLLAEESDKPFLAIAAYEEGLKENKVPEFARRHDRLVQRFGLALREVRLDFAGPAPQICLDFSDRLVANRTIKYEDYLKLAPATPGAVTVRGSSLCI